MSELSAGALSFEVKLENNTYKHIQAGAKRTHVFQIIVALFIFDVKKLCQRQNNL
jgi:hypothetical protein